MKKRYSARLKFIIPKCYSLKRKATYAKGYLNLQIFQKHIKQSDGLLGVRFLSLDCPVKTNCFCLSISIKALSLGY